MTFRKKTISAFSDGSDEDNEYFEGTAKARRLKLSGHEAVSKILVYLDQAIDVLQLDVDRYRAAKDLQRAELAKERIAWIESVKIWINRNV